MDRIEPRVLRLLHPKSRPTMAQKWAPKKSSNGRLVPTSPAPFSAGGSGPHDRSDAPDSQDTEPWRLRSFHPFPCLCTPSSTNREQARSFTPTLFFGQTQTRKEVLFLLPFHCPHGSPLTCGKFSLIAHQSFLPL